MSKLTYPRDWADFEGMLHDRVELDTAIRFVDSVQSKQLGAIIESWNQNVAAGRDPEPDPVYQTERRLRADLESAKDDLTERRDNGQQTISTDKVFRIIEDKTGYEFELQG